MIIVSGYWIGLSDQDTEGSFIWANGNHALYTKWTPGEPNNIHGNQHCGIMSNNGWSAGRWDDTECSRQYPYICESNYIRLQ